MTPTPLREAAGRMLVAGFDGPALPAHVAAALTERRLGGVILFRRNVEEPTQVADLNEQVFGAARGFIPLVSVDHEGRLYDCDFHQAEGIALGAGVATIFDVDDLGPLTGARIATAAHCFGCTAGAGSSCGGALVR